MKRSLILAPVVALCVATAALAEVNLVFKRQEGKVVTRNATHIDQTLSIAGQDIKTVADVSSTSSAHTEKPAADGTVRVKQKIEALSAKLALPGGLSVDYDSAQPEKKNDNPAVETILESFRAQKGISYSLSLDAQGNVKAVEGVEKILETAPPVAAGELKRQYSLEVLKRDTAQELAVAPGKAVNKGDRWMRTEVMYMGAGQTFTMDVFYEYQGTAERNGRMLDKIGIVVTNFKYAIDANDTLPATVVNSDLKVENSTGTVWFDREKGQVAERSSSMRITGPLTLSVMGMELPAKLDLTLESNVTNQ